MKSSAARRILALSLTFFMVFVLMYAPVTIAAPEVTVSTIADLIANLKNSEVKTINLSSAITIQSGSHTLESAKQGVTIKGRFTVGNGGTLTIGNDASETLILDADYGGSAVTVNSGGTLILNGGTITNGKANEGGGVNITGGTFNMYGGAITRNEAAKGNGGGVYVNETEKKTENSVFNMYGGVISYNKATGNTSDGGGISVAPGGTATLYAGYFYGNQAKQHGGAVGTGWPKEDRDSTTIIYNPVIAGNSAKSMGGGFYGCPEGTVANIKDGHTAIFENRLEGKLNASDQDVRVESPEVGGGNSFLVPTRMLNGALYEWANADDIVTSLAATKKYKIDGVDYPYDLACSEVEILAIIEKLEAEFPEGRVFIVNNFADGKSDSSGGGVGGNGSWVVLGEDAPKVPTDKGILTLKKMVTGSAESPADAAQAFMFTVTFAGISAPFGIKLGGTVIGSNPATVELKHGESATFTDIPAGTAYTIAEAENPAYTLVWRKDGTESGTAVGGIVSSDGAATVTATNTRNATPPGPGGGDTPSTTEPDGDDEETPTPPAPGGGTTTTAEPPTEPYV
ncbi:MAG: DUF5979 domain-containing protein, partial [Clostridiales Family XIII bacterium]|nr:DUF5979 domain-containing protein [Clostridiales Family XIII bacterium]